MITTPLSGRQVVLSQAVTADFGYTGFYQERAACLDLTWFRAYDANKARWLSRDPLGEGLGPNLYNYVGNNILGWVDPSGLGPEPPGGPWFPVPNYPPGTPWKPVPGTPQRPIKWVPDSKFKLPGGKGSRPQCSWDPEDDYWKLNDGYGNNSHPPANPPEGPPLPLPFWDFPFDIIPFIWIYTPGPNDT